MSLLWLLLRMYCLFRRLIITWHHYNQSLLLFSDIPDAVIYKNTTSNVRLGTTFAMTCNVTTNIGYTVDWFRDGINLLIQTVGLTIVDYELFNDATYTCQATNPAGVSAMSGPVNTLGYGTSYDFICHFETLKFIFSRKVMNFKNTAIVP